MKSVIYLFLLLGTLNMQAQSFATPDDIYATMSKAYQNLDVELIRNIYCADA